MAGTEKYWNRGQAFSGLLLEDNRGVKYWNRGQDSGWLFPASAPSVPRGFEFDRAILGG
jgi:hypothetical protein